ncbi:GNAT family N-acetyltransferase [Amycolatopsis halotolerans]|uniref:GNAT family N-acetyltransferase n=1 Tax=Amycolatopsis halotolerans TaxID=330083 RepID=A0ABV7QFT8_9PSEU
MDLRRATAADARDIADVWLRSFTAALPTVRRAHDDDAARWWFANIVVPQQETWVAVVKSTVAGLLVLDGSELAQLYLDLPWRGRGIGAQLVDLAKQLRPDGLTLWTFQINEPAQRFYRRHGFAAVEYTDGQRNEEREPDVRYVWPAPQAD